MKGDGSRAADGVYRLTVWTADASDNRAQRQFTVTLDTTPTVMGSSVSPTTISPNGDGRADTAALGWSAAQKVTGTGRILDATGAKVTFWTLTAGTSGLTTWTGKNTAGAVVPDGKYTYRVTGFDPAGNATNRDLPVNVDRTIASVAWSVGAFDPRAGQKTQLSFRLIRPATVTVAISLGSTVVRRVYTSASLAATTYRWTWDGKNGNGIMVKPGTYTVSVHATSAIGATKVSRAVTVRAH
jgi:flagellar hook assembly protein FlgD